MRDILLIQSDDILDIEIVNGEPEYVREEDNTNDQRAAVGAFIAKGTVPGMPDLGVDWGSFYDNSASLLDMDNQIKMNIDSLATDTVNKRGYTPLYKMEDGKLQVEVFRQE